MCGIAGFWMSIDSRDGAASTLAAMTDAMVHRGPDAAGAWIDPDAGIALGHRRLSIVELSPLGAQPMISDDERFVLVFNGEIYNHELLREELLKRGHRFRGHSDTEVLLALIARDGLHAALTRCVGMFAIAVWDRRDRVLQLARDRFGEKPLYVATIDGGIAFASTLAPIRRHPGFRASIDRGALAAYLRHGYVPAPHAIFTNAHKVEPATIVTWTGDRSNTPVVTRYWSAEDAAAAGIATPFEGSDEDAVNALDHALRRAVREQMMADVPLGAFLSGGVDSSLIVALMQAEGSRAARTFTIGFEDPAFNEAQHAAAVAAHLHTEHTTLVVTPQDALDVIPRLAGIYDEPFADSSQIPTTLVAALARRHVTVALSGDGGDELFGGYQRYAVVEQAWRRLSPVPKSMRRIAASAMTAVGAEAWDVACRASGLHSRGVTGDRIHKLAALVESPSSSSFYRDLVSSWTTPSKVVRVAQEPHSRLLQPLGRVPGGLLGEMMLRDQVTYLPDDILVKVDRATMASSLESRAPFLDHRIAELAWTLRRDQWRRDGRGKWIARAVLDRYVPRALIDRPKQGFGVPIASWLRGPLREWADDLLSPSALAADEMFDPAPIRQRWSEHQQGARNWSASLWHVLMFQAWRASNGAGA